MRGAVSVIPKGLHHLEAVHKNKFAAKFPTRLPHGPTQFVPPAQRIRRWNIRPNDRVRLLVGRARDKYLDEGRGVEGGWRVYTVSSVDLERNKVYLEGLGNKRSAMASPKPDNFNSLPEEERRRWESSANIPPASRPVHYSNVQLCVEDNDGPSSVFASRIATSPPTFNPANRRLEWVRYAARLTGTSGTTRPPDPVRGLVRIEWPKEEPSVKPSPSELDTASPGDTSLRLPTPSHLMSESVLPLVLPSSARQPVARSELSESWADAYALHPVPAETDATMPLFLSEELSPKFSRAKRQRGWRERADALAEEETQVARRAVEEWEQQGRDSALAGVLGDVGLEGVSVRGRTRKEVREAAVVEWKRRQAEVKRQVTIQVGKGMKYEAAAGAESGDPVIGGAWVPGEKERKIRTKARRRLIREGKIEEKMKGMTLEEGRNMVVPSSARA